MNVNFLMEDCRKATNIKRFGICDDEDKTPAYIDSGSDEHEWIATVINDKSKEITLRAIDNCIKAYRENGDMDSLCDVMMTYEDNIVFIELKNKRTDWKTEGIDQIEATLIRFIENHERYYYGFKKKKAFVANRKHPNFHQVENEITTKFFKKYKIWLDVQAGIVIK